jgi:D-beta-D-heptose 7-phosphate kinase / D-beta-D-heptose 1-phosphate adenosyltransferase
MRKEDLAAVVDEWAGFGALVLGDAMLDEWRFAESVRLCREAPAPVLTLRRRQTAAGGAANTAVNLAALGARPILVAPLGSDVAGDEVRDCLDRCAVRDWTVTGPGVRTPVKRRLLAADQILVREDEDADGGRPTDGMVDVLLSTLERALDELGGDGQQPILMVCDYGLGALSDRVSDWLVTHRRRFGTVALDAHDLSAWAGFSPTVVTPSYAEATRVPGAPASSDDNRAANALQAARAVRRHTGAQIVAVTIDADGAIVTNPDGDVWRSRSAPVSASHTVGAGDAYLAAMALALAVDAPGPAATELAQLAAIATLADAGTCVCRREDLLAAIDGTQSDAVAAASEPNPTVLDDDALVTVVQRHRAQGRRIVFTNGCFDVLHRGHVRYLEQARELGDLLIVAVNSDDSVRRLKGPDRPVNPVEDRVAVLAALSCIDHVVVFEEDSPTHLIAAVRPDTYVKGGDYPPEMVPEAPLVRRLGGEVRTLGYVPDRSTSAIIDKIRAEGEERATHKGLTGEPA